MVATRQSHQHDKAGDFFSRVESLGLSQEKISLLNKAQQLCQACDNSERQNTAIEMVEILVELNLDADSLATAYLTPYYLNDVVSIDAVEEHLGNHVAVLLTGVSQMATISTLAHQGNGTVQVDNIRRMLLAMVEDVRAVVIKLAEQVCHLRNVKDAAEEERVVAAKETADIFAPLANRLGIGQLKWELEDLAFKCIHPMRARMLESAVKQTVGGRKRIISKLRKQFKYHLKNNDITATVKGRQKSLSSIYSKIKNKKKPFSEILDVYAFRVIVNSVDDVYRALGVIHNVHKPIGNRFKDYIAIPKTNGYQAIHTSLIALDGVPIEVQIQTKSMEIIAQNGISAHWSYKTKDSVSSDLIGAKKWIESFTALSEASKDSHEFVESIKTDLIYDEVYVFTPAGRIVNLKSGSTPIDLAYELHTDLGNKAIACKVNRKFAPLNIRLENGQSIEIITSDKLEVSPDWLNFVVTSKARSSIRLALRQQKISQARKAGKLVLESELKRGGVSLDQYRGSTMSRILEMIGVKSLNELLTDLGSGKKTGALVAERFFSGLNIKKNKNSKLKAMVLSDHQIEGVSVIYAKCCMPIHGDPITAHSDTDRGIVIHHARCRQVAPHRSHKIPSRYFPAMWGSNSRELHYKGHVKIHAEDRPGILADIASVFTKSNLNIVNIQSRDIDAMIIEFVIEVEVLNADSINKLMVKLRSLRYVTSCSRIVNDAKTKNEKTNFYK